MEQLCLVWPEPKRTSRTALRLVAPAPEPKPAQFLHRRFPIMGQEERSRYRVVWPPPPPADAHPEQRPGHDSFADELFALDPYPAKDGAWGERPRTRSECEQRPRPCPWVSCRFNLYLDVREDGVLKLNFPDKEPEEMSASCALDLADDGPRTLDSIAALMGMSKERARQLEATAFEKLYDRLPRKGNDLDDESWI